MMRTIGTVSRGIRAPIIKKGDDLVKLVADAVLEASREQGFAFHDRDVVGVTEAVVARAQGNYATLTQIAADVRAKFPGGRLGLVFPILSRNRFSQLLRGIAMGVEHLTLQLSIPSDEVGNPLVSWDQLDEKGVNPYADILTESDFAAKFGRSSHPFTGVDYIEYYKELCAGKAEIILSSNPRAILSYEQHILCADIHTRQRTKRILESAGARTVLGIDQLLTASVDGSGYHPQYGLLGSNLATEDSVKLFPRDAEQFAADLSAALGERTGKRIEALVYGDGAFKDPVGGIWELADPVVSPGYTAGLSGTPNELKLKYLADNELGELSGEQADEAMRELIRHKTADLGMAAQGTTPRRLTDLLGSLCDLTTGSGDKGTPIVLIQGYFDTFAD